MVEFPVYTFGASVVLALVFAALNWLRISLNLAALNIDSGAAHRIRVGSAGVLLGWSGGVYLIASSPIFLAPGTIPFNPLVVVGMAVAPVALAALALLVFPRWRRLVDPTPVGWLIGTHTIRVLFGYVILVGLELHVLPSEFALEAGFGDIVVGVLAPLVAVMYVRAVPYRHEIALAWNVLGLLDLFNALRLGGANLIQTWGAAQGTPIPIGMIPLLSVPLFMIGHVYLFRLILRDRARRATNSRSTTVTGPA